MDLSADFKSFQDRVQSSLVNTTKTAGQISAEDLSFHRSSSSKLSKNSDAQNARLLQLTNRLLKAATKDTQINPPKLHTQDDVEDNWRKTVDVIDDLLEKSDACLDEFTGVIKRLSPALQDDAAMAPRKERVASIFAKSIMPKPQLRFYRTVANDQVAPFKPLLQSKPHAILSLEESIGQGEAIGCVQPNKLGVSLTHRSYKHPYATEIQQSAFTPSALVRTEPVMYTEPKWTRATMVSTEEGVQEMLAVLKQAREIAVDLEHHDTHSYIGIVCLMQISTRDQDWIVDTLMPWRENLQILNEVFADPKIVKVFHGSHEDMIWLQRDLGLYIVGLFDTYHACVALNLEGRGLKYLLKRFADFEAQKKYQTADWRVRPLPEPLIDYARSDTHYLLYIYDNLRNMLIEASTAENGLMKYVLEESKKEALQRYERPVYDIETGLGQNGWYNSVMRRNLKFNAQQFAVYRVLHQWRDQMARRTDEGLPSIMSAAQLFTISEAMPMSVSGLMSSVRPITKAIADHSRELVEIIKNAKDAGAAGESVGEILKKSKEKGEATGQCGKFFRPPKERNDRPDIGVGAMVQQLRVQQVSEPTVTRSRDSNFWGAVLMSAQSAEPAMPEMAVEALRSILPLPDRDELSFTDASALPVQQSMSESENVVSHTTNGTAAARNDVFIVRDLGKPQKRKVSEVLDMDELSTTAPMTAYNGAAAADDIDTELKAQRKEERKQRKAQKAAEEQARLQAAANAVPFDYASAPSVLHAKPAPEQRGGKGAKKPFDPYAKALDTSTGVKRERKETAGKSFTFKQ